MCSLCVLSVFSLCSLCVLCSIEEAITSSLHPDLQHSLGRLFFAPRLPAAETKTGWKSRKNHERRVMKGEKWKEGDGGGGKGREGGGGNAGGGVEGLGLGCRV
jgi:hypothetical protein